MKEFKKVMRRKSYFATALLVFLFFFCWAMEAAAGFSEVADYQIEIAKDLYKQSRWEEALHEFKKALIIEPTNEEAIYYIERLQGWLSSVAMQESAEQAPVVNTKESAAIHPEPQTGIREKEMEKAISIEETLDKFGGQILKRPTAVSVSPLPFKTYEIEKSEEELKKEMVIEEIKKKATGVPQKPATIPESARPAVQLEGNTSYTIIDYHVAPTYHSLFYSLAGRVYDFGLKFETNYKDIGSQFSHDYTYLNLNRPGLLISLFDQSISLGSLRMQSESFNGLKIIKDWGKSQTTLIAGATDNTAFGTSTSVKYLGNIYGLKERFSPLKWLDLGGAVFYWENEADIPSLSGSTNFPRENIITYQEATLKLPGDLTVSGQIGQCNYQPDNAPQESVNDLDWRISSQIRKERYRVGLDYEFIGDRYASFGSYPSYQDYSGWNLYGDYKMSDNWHLSSSLMQYNNNVADDPNKATQDNIGFSLSSYHRLANDQGLNLTYSHFYSAISSPVESDSTNITDLYRSDYSLPFFFGTRAVAGYQLFFNDSTESSTVDYRQHTPSISLFKSFGKNSTWYLSHQFMNMDYKEGADNNNSTTSFNINYVLNDLINAYFNTSYSRDKTGSSSATDTLSASSGFNYRIFPDTILNCEYNIGSYNLDTEKHRWPRNWSIMGRISQSFDFATAPNFGSIEGYVFNDVNGNSRIDREEPGLEDIRLYLEDGRETFTNKSGRFKFSYVAPEIQKVSLDLGSLPAPWAIKEVVRQVRPRPRRKTYVDFPVIKASSIEGKVFIDKNSDSIYQQNEEPLENIAIIIMPQEQFRRTDEEGDFKFDNLLPGKYKVRINSRDIPFGYELISVPEIEVELTADKKLKGVNFILRLNPQAVKKF